MKTRRILNTPLTVEELKEAGVNLALENQKKARLEDAKKQAMSQYKAEIDAVDASINAIASKLARGSEDRTVECTILYNTPIDGQKTVVRDDTGATVSIEKMTDDEMADLLINAIGANKDAEKFVFRDKTSCRMLAAEQYEKIKNARWSLQPGEFTEKELVDDKPECDLELVLVVYRNDPKKGELFSVYFFEGKIS